MAVAIGCPGLVSGRIIRIFRNTAQRIHTSHQTIAAVILKCIDAGFIISDPNDIAVSIIGHRRYKAILRGCADDMAGTVIRVGNFTSVRIDGLLHISIPVIPVIHGISQSIFHRNGNAKELVISCFYRISQTVCCCSCMSFAV